MFPAGLCFSDFPFSDRLNGWRQRPWITRRGRNQRPTRRPKKELLWQRWQSLARFPLFWNGSVSAQLSLSGLSVNFWFNPSESFCFSSFLFWFWFLASFQFGRTLLTKCISSVLKALSGCFIRCLWLSIWSIWTSTFSDYFLEKGVKEFQLRVLG